MKSRELKFMRKIWDPGGWVSEVDHAISLIVKLDGVTSGWHDLFESVLVWGSKSSR